MQTVDHLRGLFQYNDWANSKIIAALRTNECQRARAILAHLVTTEQEYFERLSGKDSTGFDFWPVMDMDEIEVLAKATAVRYRELIDSSSEHDLDRTASYRTSQGVPCTDSFRDLFTHVVVHSSIHRGNIMIKLREAGTEPPVIDYIVYLREKKSD